MRTAARPAAVRCPWGPIARLVVLAASIGACSTPGNGGGGSGGAPAGVDGSDDTTPAGPSMVVTAFDGAHVYFAGADNKRIIDAAVTFPEMPASYETITLNLNLRCPPGGCDFWDRRAFLGVVQRAGEKDESVTEIARFMTPYRVGAIWTMDVTALRPLLSGAITLRLFVDTWVGPGHAQGAGWLIDAAFDLRGGVPARRPIAVLPLWDETAVDYGDPAKPSSASAPPRTATLPADTTFVELRSFITGHGQGNAENCAEFCNKLHSFTVGEQVFERQVWRTDCATSTVPGQAGTFRYSRAGWCPGATVQPWVVDVTAAVQAGTETSVAYAISSYENTCRPDATPCRGCAPGGVCAFDSGGHTPPFFDLSALLIAYH